jgi:hypothetical protein
VLIPGLSNKDAEGVFVGGTAAAAVYLGTTLVWPNVTQGTGVMGEQLIINPTNDTAGTMQRLTIPAAATKFDVVLIGGGGGGGDGGTLGPGEGGICGVWQTATYTVGASGDYPAGHNLILYVGFGGAGGTALVNTGGVQGANSALYGVNGTDGFPILSGPGGKPNKAPDRSGLTPPDCVYNGRTYKGGAGGVSANQNGVDGAAPGGGGQGGNDEINGNDGGKGGSGGIYLYFY